jgi:BirA family transcriptional regulator, biotin operon repressor / biotin---[acetyl-CoA-carboxylase] ligase
MFDPVRFRSLLTTATIGRSFAYEPVVGSTMDLAREAGRAGAPHGHVVLADEQTAGRGRFGRRWVAPAGVNLTFTVLLRPDLRALERLSMIAALGVAEGVRAACGVEPRFKWPNDVQLEGRKLAGILIEAELQGDRPDFALVGIGLNVNLATAAAAEIAAIAVSLRDVTGHAQEREGVLAAVLAALEGWYDRVEEPPVHRAWAARLVTLGQAIGVSFAGRVERGVAESVTETGALRLRRADGSLVVLPAGEVTTRVE